MSRRAASAPDLLSSGRRIGRTEPPLFLLPALGTRALEALLHGPGPMAKCTALVAPVGYGKTVLMAQWFKELQRSGKQCRWLALDAADARIDGVLSDLEALLQSAPPRRDPMPALFREREPVDRRIEAVVQELNALPWPLTLVIDNLHHCHDPAFARLLGLLVFRTPASVRLVFASTAPLPIDLPRAQLRGLMMQLGPDDLAFSPTEVARLLGPALGQRLGPQGVDEVVRRTEGWPAAVRMVQIILTGAPDPLQALQAFSGADQTLAQLLHRQVLSGFPAAVGDFLLRLALLNSFCAELCCEAIDACHAREHLACLLERNAFLVPLDRNRQWYRLHGLFRDHLLGEAQARLDTEQRHAVLRSAARWCADHDQPRDALDYAVACGDAATANAVLEAAAESFVRDRGDTQHYIHWIETLHRQGVAVSPEAEYWFIWALAFHHRYEYARRHCAQLAQRFSGTEAGPAGRREGLPALQRRVAILQASIDCLTDRLEDAHRGAARWLEAAEERDDPFDRTVARCIESAYLTNDLRFVEAQRSLQAARRSACQANSPNVDGWVACYAGWALVQEGRLGAAHADVIDAWAKARRTLGEDAGVCGMLACVAACCAAEMGLYDDARQLVRFGLRTARHHGFLETAACGLQAALQVWQGDTDDPLLSHGALREVAGAHAPRLSLMYSCMLARRLARLNRLDEALREIAHAGLDIEGNGREREERSTGIAQLDMLVAATKIDLMIATGRHRHVMSRIAKEQRKAKARRCEVRQVELALDSASLARRAGEPLHAARHVMRAIRLATPHCIVRPFDDHARLLAVLLAGTPAAAWAFACEEERQFFGSLRQRLHTGAAIPVASIAAASPPAVPVRPVGVLTARELELLGFIGAGLTNQQIADRIDVSLTTVKWHLQNAYGKLGVANRSAALAAARMLNLVA